MHRKWHHKYRKWCHKSCDYKTISHHMAPKSKNCTAFPYTLLHSPHLNVSTSSYLKGNHKFCNFGGSLMKDPGKWNGSIDYINGTMVEGIIPRYQEEGKWMRQLCWETEYLTIKDLIKGYSWCPWIHERKTIIIIFWTFIIIDSIPRYVIAVVNKHFKKFKHFIIYNIALHTPKNPN